MSQEVVNTSGLVPVGRAVLVESYEPELKKSALVIPDSVKERTVAAEVRAIVIAVGPDAWADEGEQRWVPAGQMGPDKVYDQTEGRYVFIKRPRAKPGDKVMITRFAGMVITQGTADGRTYRMVNANDIFLRIESEGAGIGASATRQPIKEVA